MYLQGAWKGSGRCQVQVSQNSSSQDSSSQDRSGQDRSSQDRSSQDRSSRDRWSQARSSQDSLIQDRSSQDWSCQDRSSKDRASQDRSSQKRSGQDRSCQDMTNQVRSKKFYGKKKLTCLNDQANSCLIHFFHCYCFLLTACCLLLEILRNSSLQTFFWSSLKLRSCATAQLLLWKQYGPEKRSELKGWVVLTAWNTAQQQSQNIFLEQSESQKLRNSATKILIQLALN